MTTAEILVPVLGESVTEATVAKWHKNKGETVKKDEILVDLETDKITLEVTANENGVLDEIICIAGATVSIGAILGKIVVGAIPISNIENTKTPPNAEKQIITQNSQNKPYPSPAAQVTIDSNNISANSINGSGKDGRITKSDAIKEVEFSTPNPTTQHFQQKASQVSQQPSVLKQQQSDRRENRVRMTRLRQTISKRLKEVQSTAAILSTFNEIDMFEIMQLRTEHQETFQKRHDIKLGFMSFFVKAVVIALQELPIINAEIDANDIVYKNFYDIGVAVGTDNGLVVPIIRDADALSLADIEKNIAVLGKKARDGKLSMADMIGGTFTITNGGTYGSLLSTPIINPPQSAILGMHNIVQRPVGLNGEIVLRPMMYIALSYDHRIIDGKEAVQFLVKIKQLLEKPAKILLQI
jgi:2-oxoglutarate dehydrogenase E2 component (dihydrolipoamide succinyltransferase)